MPEPTQRPEPPFSFGLRVFITLAILVLVDMLARIPAPGIDAGTLMSSTGYGPLDATAMASTSIVALKFSPVISALVFVEAMKLALPHLTNWESRDPQHKAKLTRGLLILAFALALLQGWGVASALGKVKTDAMLVPEPGDFYRFTFALTQIAGTAALVVLAEAITRFGIGSGYWVMIAWFGLSGAALAAGAVYGSLRDGSLDPVSAGGLALTVIGGAAVAIALYRKGIGVGITAASAAADVILPPFLGTALGALLYGLGVLALAILSGQPIDPDAMTWSSPVQLATLCAAILLIALLRVKDKSRAFQIAAFGSALLLALHFAAQSTGTPPLNASAIIIAAVTLALGWDQSRPRLVTGASV